MFAIHLGVPEMEQYWNELSGKVKTGKAGAEDRKMFQKLGKAMKLLSEDPRHPGLNSHEISTLSRRYGRKVWESYLENRTPAAGRMFWVYGPSQKDITIIGIEPHPNDKSSAYKKITLSQMGEEIR